MNMRSYNSRHFKAFMKKLKKDGLWSRFRILEYYYRYYLDGTNLLLLYKALNEPEEYTVGYEEDISKHYKVLENENGYTVLSDLFKYFKV